MDVKKVKTPWIKSLGGIPSSLEYFRGSMFELVEDACKKYGDITALIFQNFKVSYTKLLYNIEKCAKGLKAIGVTEGSSVTISLPNCPQAIYMFYAVNAIGGVANMVHPLSSESEMKFYINKAKSKTLVILDRFYPSVENILQDTRLNHVIVTKVEDVFPNPIRFLYSLTQISKVPKIPDSDLIVPWRYLMDLGGNYTGNYKVKRSANDVATILYSGGTTGKPKGIRLTNLSFNSLSLQLTTVAQFVEGIGYGDKFLSILPLFHGFGLGVCIHTVLTSGRTSILMPRFNIKQYCHLLKKYECNYIVGVPELLKAILITPYLKNTDLSFLKGVFVGGDALPVDLEDKFNMFLKNHNANISVQEGYGTTETTTACCLSPLHGSKTGSFGLPFPDTFIKIVRPNTDIEVPYGQEGEILLSGPSMMKDYLDEPEETANTLRKHTDGLTWVYTGDIGVMDEDGFTYFKGRIKRMLVSSGYNIYPEQLEAVIRKCDCVRDCCIVGISSKYKKLLLKAYVVLEKGILKNDKTREYILKFCSKNIAKYAIPKDIEFIDQLPKTLVKKVDFTSLEEKSTTVSLK